MDGMQVAMLVGGILLTVALTQAIVWFFVLRWIRSASARVTTELEAAMRDGGESVRRRPTRAQFNGSTSGAYGRRRSTALVALGDRRLHIQALSGRPIVIERGQVTNVRPEAWFRSARRLGWTHVVLTMREGGELGFALPSTDAEAWVHDVRSVLVADD